jgi:FemAB family protein
MSLSQFNKLLEDLERLLVEVGLHAKKRKEALSDWQQTTHKIAYLPVDYSGPMIDYQIEYFSGNGLACKDISLVLMHDNSPCGLWPLSATFESDGRWRIGSSGAAVLPPLFVAGLARKSVKSMTAGCFKFLVSLCAHIGQPGFDTAEPFSGGEGLSVWHDQLMQGDAKVELRHDLFIDLSGSLAEIKSGFRKSYKSLITSGSKLWKIQVITVADPQQWDEFRALHRAISGRVTRSDESWCLQHEAIASGDAFFVCLRDDAESMVGGGLFHVTEHEGFYAIGAYDRSLFDKPLGHVVQYHAIEEMKSRGLKWYKLGPRFYPSDIPSPSDKEITISQFKQGFASHLFPRYGVWNEPRRK